MEVCMIKLSIDVSYLHSIQYDIWYTTTWITKDGSLTRVSDIYISHIHSQPISRGVALWEFAGTDHRAPVLQLQSTYTFLIFSNTSVYVKLKGRDVCYNSIGLFLTKHWCDCVYSYLCARKVFHIRELSFFLLIKALCRSNMIRSTCQRIYYDPNL